MADKLASERHLVSAYLLEALMQALHALQLAEHDPRGTGTRAQLAEAIKVYSCLHLRMKRSSANSSKAWSGESIRCDKRVDHIYACNTPILLNFRTPACQTLSSKTQKAWSRETLTLTRTQELLRIPVRHPKLLAMLRAEDPKRVGVANLAAFNDRLWRMTDRPLRYFQEVAFWVLQHTAALELQDTGPRSGILTTALPVGWLADLQSAYT